MKGNGPPVSFRVLVGILAALGVIVVWVSLSTGGDRETPPGKEQPRAGEQPKPPALPPCRQGEDPAVDSAEADWQRTLVDDRFALPKDYEPSDLVPVSAARFEGDFRVRRLMLGDLEALGDAAAKAGNPLGIVAAYRSFDEQASLYERREGTPEQARTARPGHSEHQLGTGIDFATKGETDVTRAWAADPAGEWMAGHAHEFGFVLSFPKGATRKTCFGYEPWHFRYFGPELAARIHESGLTTREFLWTNRTGTPVSPAPSPSHEGSRKEPRKRKLVIHGAGDVNVDPNYVTTFGSNGYGYAWSGLGGLFKRDDLTVVNLECPVSDKGQIVKKEFNFRCDPAALPAMRQAGVDVANQGNNHAYDFGEDALVDSLRNLERARVSPVGAGRDEEDALRPAIFEEKGWRIAVLGFGNVVEPYPLAVAAADHPGVAAGHDVNAMTKAIRDAKRSADLVIVTIHWGIELHTQPEGYQVVMGHKFVKAGADVIFGHHAHRLQPLDHYKGKPIFWGLGNFVWPDHSAEGSATAVGEVTVMPNGRLKGKLLPATIVEDGHPVLN
ncbi:MAG: CapA family protein [Actinomycetota bacterium]